MSIVNRCTPGTSRDDLLDADSSRTRNFFLQFLGDSISSRTYKTGGEVVSVRTFGP